MTTDEREKHAQDIARKFAKRFVEHVELLGGKFPDEYRESLTESVIGHYMIGYHHGAVDAISHLQEMERLAREGA